MASDIESTLKRLSEKSRFLTERFKVVSQERDEAQTQVSELQKALAERDRKMQRMGVELEYLKVSSAISPTAETVEATRAILRGLIADIDRCIAELND